MLLGRRFAECCGGPDGHLSQTVLDLFLPVFPEGLANSVVTTILIGVWVIAFFNLRLGWVLSGLVVPGYLVPMLIDSPLAVIAIVVEAAATYCLIWLYSERLSRRAWSALFGRDRFLAIILASVVCRIVFDLWLLPLVEQMLPEFGLNCTIGSKASVW